MRSLSDAVVLLAADGLVAAGRVLGGLRRRCDTERRADALAVAEESRECWEPNELCASSEVGAKAPKWVRDSLDMNRHSLAAIDELTGTRWCYAHKSLSRDCLHEPTFCRLRYYPGDRAPGMCDLEEKPCDPVCPSCVKDWAAQRSAAVTVPAADNTPDCGCGSGERCPDPITCPDAVVAAMAEDTAAADGTQLFDSIVALWDYHTLRHDWSDIGWWGCDGCNWTGVGERQHLLQRLALIADMKAATTRVQQRLGGAS